jgi:KDO2-lipid IV(A) lauroyltransferase
MQAPPLVDAPPARPAWWLRALGRLPLPLMYGLAGFVAWLLRDVFRYRVRVVRENLRGALPELGEAERRQILRRHYRALADVLFELPRVAVMPAAEVRERVLVPDMPAVHAELARGRPVLVVTAHYCNWEWLLQALALDLGVPLLAAYKPPHHAGADRLMQALRGRFGVRMVPGKRLVREVLRRRGQPHTIGMVADQMPTSSAGRVWLKFLGRDTAFFPGPAEVARLGGYSAYFLALRRLRRGYYEVRFEPLAAAGENLDVPTFTARYAAHLEGEIRRDPADWAWTHRRWKLQPPAALAGPAADSSAAKS